MMTKSSKSLSRKELLLEYAKLRELYELQEAELRANKHQTRQLAHALSEHMNSDRIDKSSAPAEPPAEDPGALEQSLRQKFEDEKLDIIVKLKRVHAINLKLVEAINRMQQSEEGLQAEPEDDNLAEFGNKVTPLKPTAPVGDDAPASKEDSQPQVLPIAQ